VTSVVAKQVVPGLYRIPFFLGPIPYTTGYLIDGDDGFVLVDTGIPGRATAVLRSLTALRRQAADVKHILITHHHYDHTGNLAELAARTDATVYVHPLDAPITRGDVTIPQTTKNGLGAKVITSISKRMMPERLPPVEIGHELHDGEELPLAGGIVAVHTPGHTAGHTSFLWKRHGGVLLVGDAAGNMGPRLGPPIGVFTEDDGAMRRSVAKLAGFTFDKAVFGHGNPIRAGASAKFARLADRLNG
jgi:glyoxylase-like metal-dependent hydrolase (beta-lactamase superfamily II)